MMTSLRSGISYFDRNFSQSNTANYCLSIRLEPDGLLFSVYDTINQQYIAFETTLHGGIAELYSFIADHKWLKDDFSKVTVIFPGSIYTIIPNVLYNPSNEEEYFSFSHQLPSGYLISSTILTQTDARIIYATNSAWLQIINDFFPTSIRLPQSACFINFILPRFRNSTNTTLFLNLYNEDFDLLVLEQGKLKLCNNYVYKSAEDVAYYTLFVMDQLSLNPETIVLNLSGKVDGKSPLLRLLRKYIRFVNILNYNEGLKLSYALSEVNPHMFTDILNPMLCE